MKFKLTNSLIFFVIASTSFLLSQKIATTNDGKIVLLNEDGTWKYQQTEKKSSKNNSFGEWRVNYYVDEFGDPTSVGYVTNKSSLIGTFSNSATTNSKLKAYFLISEELDDFGNKMNNSVSIKLFEYAGKTEVKGTISSIKYSMLVKHNSKKVNTSFTLNNFSDRAVIKSDQVNEFIDLLKLGGRFQFILNEVGQYSQSTYKLSIDEASGFDNAWNNLTNSDK